MAVPVGTRTTFRVGVPAKLFNGDEVGVGLYSLSPVISAYDASPDGKHFVAVRRSGGAGNYLTVVQNWLAEFQNGR